jgi:tRNA pseudouridine65 synthase
MDGAALPILYRSSALVAVDKPSGMAVHRGFSCDRIHALNVVRDQIGAYVYPVHRLDRGTSGVLVFALSSDAARLVSRSFEQGLVEKTYLALVRGKPPDQVTIDHPLTREGGRDPQAAVTEVRTLARYGRYAWVEARPLTGRLHQIRRHLKHLSCPLIGDVRYGKGEHNRFFRNEYALARLALHAGALSLPDPASGERVRIVAELPDDLSRTLARLASDRVCVE